MTNNYKWDLSKLYTGYDDPIFLKDYDQLVNGSLTPLFTIDLKHSA